MKKEKLMNEKIQSGKIIVKDIEVNGTENLIKKLGNDTKLVTIFLKVDKEELKNRLINRGDNLSEADMQLRLNRLEYEESKIGLYDYVIKNDDLEKTVQIIMTIIENEKVNFFTAFKLCCMCFASADQRSGKVQD